MIHSGNAIADWIKPADDRQWQLAIMRSSDGSIIKFLDIPKTNSINRQPTDLEFHSSGILTALKYLDSAGRRRSACPGTKFTSDNILNFDLSRTGVLVCSRLERTSDVVLIRDFR